jgi:BASS family bile acid:Na+ symporter
MLAAALFSIVLVPLTLRIVESLFHVPVGMTPTAIARIMVTTVLAPLMVGAATHSVAPRFAKRLARPVALLATILLVICVLPVIVIAWPAMIALIGNGTLVALAAFVVAGLIGGHLLGGPTDEDRTVLALTTATRHPGLALAIAQTNFPQEKSTLAAIMLYLLVGAIVSIPYLNWRKRHPSIRPRPSRIHPGPTMARP